MMSDVGFSVGVLIGASLLLFRKPFIRQMMEGYQKWGWPHGSAIERFVMAMTVIVGLAFLLIGICGILGVIQQP